MKKTFVKSIPKEKLNNLIEAIKTKFSHILSEIPPKNKYELTRFKSDKSTLVVYRTGKVVLMHENLNTIEDFLISFLQEDQFEVIIGIDETGKGELFGGIIVCGVKIEKNFKEIEKLVSTLNTKNKNSYDKYKTVFNKLIELGVEFVVEEIIPSYIKEKSTNLLLSETYYNILRILYPKEDKKTRIVLDNFGINKKIKKKIYSTFPKAKIIVEYKADDNYLECKVASIISKYFREEFLIRINESYYIDNLKPGDGNLSKKDTLEWLQKWLEKNKKIPPFVKNWKRVIDKVNLKNINS